MSIRKNIVIAVFTFFVFTALYHVGYTQTTDTLTNGLVGHWKFDAINTTTFTTADTSTNNNTGTLGTTTRFVAGKFGQAMKFDENVRNQYMTTSKTFTSPQWSVSTWVNPEFPLPLGAPYNGLIAFFSTDPGGQMLGIQKGGVYMYTTKIATYDFANNPGWHHIVVTYDGTNLTAVVDNSAKGSIPYKNLMASNIKRHIGVNVPEGTYHMFKGMIDETRLYNRVLTSNEITSLFNNTASAPVTLAPTPTLTPTLISATPVAV
ncbi:MAG: LamG domain-containing protein, partial [Candidatus Pacebacteria bacterium]|nr:LamG domain-containing protein [Candidatus Paceibacterota bacterium]